MQNFFSSILASISSIEFYRQVLYMPFWQVVRFYLLFMLLIVTILTADYWLDTKQEYDQMVDAAAQEALNKYPSELTIDWTGTELRSNQDPLAITLPESLPEEISSLADYSLVITSQQTPSPTLNALFISSPSHIYSVNEGALSQGIPLADILGEETFQINQQNLPEYIEKAKNIADLIVTISAYVFPVISYIFLVTSSLIVLLFDTLIIFLFIKLQRLAINYSQLFQLGIALLVPAQIVDLVVKLAELELSISMLSLSFWILFIVVFFSLQRKLSV